MTLPAPFPHLARTAILVVGAPRSGTTWLAKILDSHPDVLYRHEPDEVIPTPDPLLDHAACELLERWIRQRDTRTAARQPFFAKSYQSSPAYLARSAVAYALKAASRLPVVGPAAGRAPVPDFAVLRRARVVCKSVRLGGIAEVFARGLPDARILFLLRHPGGQVASLMRGTDMRRFDLRETGTDMPFDEHRARGFAAQHGVDDTAFTALPPAAQYAWEWRAYNETALAGLGGRSNVRVVIHERLCAAPEAGSRALLAFAGLPWHAQTQDFLARSTSHTGDAGYYAVFRNALEAAEKWRRTMAPADQAAIRAVMRGSPLAGHWPDLANDRLSTPGAQP